MISKKLDSQTIFLVRSWFRQGARAFHNKAKDKGPQGHRLQEVGDELLRIADGSPSEDELDPITAVMVFTAMDVGVQELQALARSGRGAHKKHHRVAKELKRIATAWRRAQEQGHE